MDAGAAAIALVATTSIFSIPLVGIWTEHRRKMLELQLKLRQQGDGSVKQELESLRQEMRQLRDTTMQYDLSFDSALQRMEGRMENVERRVNAVESNDNVARLNTGR